MRQVLWDGSVAGDMATGDRGLSVSLGKANALREAMTTGRLGGERNAGERWLQLKNILEAFQLPEPPQLGDRSGPTYLCGTGSPGPQGNPEAVQPAVKRHLPRCVPAGCASRRGVLSSFGIPPGEQRVTEN